MRRLGATATLAVLAFAAPAAGAAPEVMMRTKLFMPRHTVALVGESVTWVNDDSVAHDVATFAPLFDSGRMEPGARFSYAFTAQGGFDYHCTLHRFMFGRLDVYGLALQAPEDRLLAGETTTLTGRAPAGTGALSVERRGSDGAFAAVGSTTPGADGAFRARVTPDRPAVYRARAGELTSPDVRVGVSARLTLGAARRGPRIVVRVRSTPAQPRARVVLQRYVRERFDWRTVSRARLDAGSRATFAVRSRHHERFRVVLPAGVGGYGPATSSTLDVATGPDTG